MAKTWCSIGVSQKTKDILTALKIHPKQSFDEVITKYTKYKQEGDFHTNNRNGTGTEQCTEDNTPTNA